MGYISKFGHRIAGIPCQIGVRAIHKQRPWAGSIQTAPSEMDYQGYVDAEYDILDRRGYPAPWLMRKMSVEDFELVEAEIEQGLYKSCSEVG